MTEAEVEAGACGWFQSLKFNLRTVVEIDDAGERADLTRILLEGRLAAARHRLNPFAGSYTTGEICEAEGRNWIAFELDKEYLETSRYRFEPRPAEATTPVPTNRDTLAGARRRGRSKNRASSANGQAELF